MNKKISIAMLLALGLALTLALATEGFAVEAQFYPVKVEPLRIAPGDTAVLNVTLKNLQPNFALYLKASLDPEDATPIDPLGSATIWVTKRAREAQESQEYFGAVLQGEEVKISFPIYARLGTKERVYEVPLVLKWKNDKLQDVEQVIKIGILVKGDINISIASIKTDPLEVRAGDDDVKLEITLENSGEAEARNIRAKLILDNLSLAFKPSYSRSDEAFVGKLSPSESQACVFYVDVSEVAKPGKYVFPLRIRYDDTEGNSYEVFEDVELLLEPKPYFVVSKIEQKPKLLHPRESCLLYITIRNVGYEKGESVDLRVVREASQPFSFDVRSDYIGTLEPGEEGVAILKFSVDKGALPKKYFLKVIVRATGDSERGDTNVYTQSLKVPVVVSGGGGVAHSNSKLIGIGIIAIVVAIALARHYARRRKGE